MQTIFHYMKGGESPLNSENRGKTVITDTGNATEVSRKISCNANRVSYLIKLSLNI